MCSKGEKPVDLAVIQCERPLSAANCRYRSEAILGRSCPIPVVRAWGITLDKDGNIYVADWKHHRVWKLSPEDKLLMKFGQARATRRADQLLCRDNAGALHHARLSENRGLMNHPTDVFDLRVVSHFK